MPGVVSHPLCGAWLLQPQETRTHISLFHFALKIVFQQFPSTCQDSDPKGCERIHHYVSSTKMYQTPIKCQAPRWALGTQGESARRYLQWGDRGKTSSGHGSHDVRGTKWGMLTVGEGAWKERREGTGVRRGGRWGWVFEEGEQHMQRS